VSAVPNWRPGDKVYIDGRPRYRISAVIPVNSLESPFEVVITASGRASFADLGYGSGYEVGGGLWGYRDCSTLVVRFATQNNSPATAAKARAASACRSRV
jgi:hypothetical protein